MNIENLTEEDFIELAKYTRHLEKENDTLKRQNEELKTNLLAIVHQRNSLHRKNEDMKNQLVVDNLQYVKADVVTSTDLTNPEQYRIEQYKPQKKSLLD